MDQVVAILGGSGFVGRSIMDRWSSHPRPPLRVLVHRSRPQWLHGEKGEIVPVDLRDTASLYSALEGVTCLVNLLRPDGSGWMTNAMQAILPTLAQTSVSRIVHASSIDVYGATPVAYVTEDTEPQPGTDYEREHWEIEMLVSAGETESCIVRPGAIFGPGGSNLVAFVPEIRSAPLTKLAVRRALYGRRRMHLVSVENVADAIAHLACWHAEKPVRRVIVTDDDMPENNFAFVQETMAEIFGRPSLDWVPELPSIFLHAALLARGRSGTSPMRRFSNLRLRETGFAPLEPFPTRLRQYVRYLKNADGMAKR